jgi:selenocysteine lyase/cysteine desulfurase
LSFKRLFSRSLGADPSRLHMAAHSHHLWPDASYDGQLAAWSDAALHADRKWQPVMDEIWPEAQAFVADELGTGRTDSIVFSSNTHDFLIRLVSAAPRAEGILRVLTTDGEFHSARRQFARWAEDGWFVLETVAAEPFATLGERFLERARSGDHDLIMVSQVLFNSGQVFAKVDQIAALARPEGPWVVIDGYHAFMALDRPFSGAASSSAFYLGGGYKYAMSGEGCAFLHAPPGFGERPPVTGWYAEFGDLHEPPGGGIGYTSDAMRFMGATFDPSSLYRFTAVQRMLRENQLTTSHISAHVRALQERLVDAIADTPLGYAELLNPLNGPHHARFMAFRNTKAQNWCAELMARNIITDVRGNVLRIGLAIYHDAEDVDRFAELAAGLS